MAELNKKNKLPLSKLRGIKWNATSCGELTSRPARGGIKIPAEIDGIIKVLEKAGFEAYIVGGCVRDLLRNVQPKDWDITTNARPEQIQKVFPESYYKNKFGTVTIKNQKSKIIEEVEEIEITTYRTEAKYSDKRHPDKISFAKTLEEDLKRRDFTINAMAFDGKKIIDLFNGQKDLENKLIRAVGIPEKRFNEDALRLTRAIRFAAELDFEIEKETFEALKKLSATIEIIAKERIRDELIKIIMSDNPKKGFDLLANANLLKRIMPEIIEGIDVSQNKHHKYAVYEHIMYALNYTAKKKTNLTVRLAVLFHDIAKPRVKEGEGPDAHFYAHEVVGAKMAENIMKRLKFPVKTIAIVKNLVFAHMFKYEVGEVTERAVRRTVRKIGTDNIKNLYNLRIADRMGSGVPKAEPYRIRHWLYTAEKVAKDPISVKMLKIDGHKIMDILNIQPGPKVGLILNALLSEVLDDPTKNNLEYLEQRTKELDKKNEKAIKEMTRKAEIFIEEEDKKHKAKYYLS